MGFIKDAIKKIYSDAGVEIEFFNTKPRVIQTTAQAKYADLRKTEPGYIQGVHRARKENTKTKKFTELCPYCNTENEFEYIGNIFYCCNSCGMMLAPCSLCDMDSVDCSKCEIHGKQEETDSKGGKHGNHLY